MLPFVPSTSVPPEPIRLKLLSASNVPDRSDSELSAVFPATMQPFRVTEWGSGQELMMCTPLQPLVPIVLLLMVSSVRLAVADVSVALLMRMAADADALLPL